MDTGQIRSTAVIAQEPLPYRTTPTPTPTPAVTQRTPGVGETTSVGTDLATASPETSSSGLKTRYDRDLNSGAMVYQWIDQLTEAVVMQIPKEQTVMTMKRVYTEVPSNQAQTTIKIDRSV